METEKSAHSELSLAAGGDGGTPAPGNCDAKRCGKCHVTKPLSSFYRNQLPSFPHQQYSSNCKECSCAASRALYRARKLNKARQK